MRTVSVYLTSETNISKRPLRDYWEKEQEAWPYLETWYESVKEANWRKPSDIKKFYTTFSILKGARVVFNIKGNKYRPIAKINYVKSWLFIRFIGTHEEYDKINAEEI